MERHETKPAQSRLKPALRDAVAKQIARRMLVTAAAFSHMPEYDVIERTLSRQGIQHSASPFMDLLQAAARRDLVTIIVPAYNAAEHIGETLDSLLGQTHPRLQVVVVNDGSTDATADLLAAYQERGVEALHLPQNAGIARAKNEGLRVARGEWVAFLSADDLYYPEAVERLLAALYAHPDADLAYSDFECFGECDYVEEPACVDRLRPVTLEDLLSGETVGMCVLFRRSLLEGLDGPVDEAPELVGVEDAVLWQDLWSRTVFVHVPEVLGRYRRHNRQLTRHITRSGGYQLQLAASRQRYYYRYGMPRRLLFVYPWCCVGGAELVMARLGAGLRRYGVAAEACFLEDGGGLPSFSEFCPATILETSGDGRSQSQALGEFIRAGGYDVVQYSYASEIGEALEAADFRGAVVEVDHGWTERCRAEIVQPDALVAVSQHKARALTGRGIGVSPRVIHNGVDVARYGTFVDSLAERMVTRPHPIVAWVGRIDAVKRPWLFCELAAALSAERPEIDFYMVGSLSSWTLPELVEQVRLSCEHHPRLRFFPGIKPGDMLAFYAMVRASGGALVMTSADEALPLVPIEAMAAGIPVVAPRVGGIPEIIDDRKDGLLLTEPFPVRQAADCVAQLLDDDDWYHEMSRHAQTTAQQRFSLEAMVKSYWHLYASLCGW